MEPIAKVANIKERLQELATPEAKAAYERTVRPQRKIYGVRTPLLNDLAREFSAEGIGVVELLWRGGSYEERLITTKILGRFGRKLPRETWGKILAFTQDLDDWATCDTLAVEAVRSLLPTLSDEVFAAAMRFCAEDGEWQRRFGLVLLTHFVNDASRRPALLQTIDVLAADKRHFVKKAIQWLRRDLAKASC